MATAAPLPKVALSLQEAERKILTPQTIAFLRELDKRFESTRLDMLEKRRERQGHYDRGGFPRFNPESGHIRDGNWRVAEIPEELLDRRVEITGPTERKMVINALNSGASVFMADFEDANSPTWSNCIEGQRNVREANSARLHGSLPKASYTN